MRRTYFTSGLWYTLFLLLLLSCSDSGPSTPQDPDPDPGEKIYTIPLVVHVVHMGEEIGEGHNLSVEQIESQIRVLNEDFRRKPGTRGYNEHPDGGDARIEFVLAKSDPEGNPTDGIVRINANDHGEQVRYHDFEYYAALSYWNPEYYLNVWTEPMPGELTGIVLGKGTGPQTDLPGSDKLLRGEPEYREGVLVNAAHFGETSIESD